MIQAYEGVVRVTGLQFRRGNQVLDMNLVIKSGQEETSIEVKIGKKVTTIKIARKTAELLASFFRRMLYDAGRARRIIQRP